MRRTTPIGLLFLLVPALVLGSEAAHAEHGHGAIPWATLIFSTINLLIFIALLRRFVWPALRAWAQDRHQLVVETLEQAARAKRAAETLKAEWEQRVANLTAELDDLRRQTGAEIAREREQILSAAEKAAASIRRDAERAAEQELRNAQTLLREEVARQALEVARELALQRLNPPTQDQFLTDFLNKVQA